MISLPLRRTCLIDRTVDPVSRDCVAVHGGGASRKRRRPRGRGRPRERSAGGAAHARAAASTGG
eukprot:291094-Prymnesium_polylepis.1